MTTAVEKAPAPPQLAASEAIPLWVFLRRAMPLIAGMALYSITGLVDAAMVGSLGNAALAGVGLAGFVYFLAMGPWLGAAVGVQTLTARRVGEGRTIEWTRPLLSALVIVGAVGLPMSVALSALAPWYFPLLNPDPEVAHHGSGYLSTVVVGLVPAGAVVAFRGYLTALSRTGLYFRALLVTQAINVALNWVLIFGNLGAPRMGAAGAGLASAIAQFACLFICVAGAHRDAKARSLPLSPPSRGLLKSIVRLSIPAIVRQTFYAGGMTIFFIIAGLVSTETLAATEVLAKIATFFVLIEVGFGVSGAPLVGTALGRNDPEGAHRAGLYVARVAAVALTVLALPCAVAPRSVLAIFIQDPATIEIAVLPLRMVALFIGVDAIGVVLMNAMMGAGDTLTPAIVSIAFQWGLCLPIAFLVGPTWGLGLTAVWLAYFGYRAMQTAVYAMLWRRRKWATVSV